MDLYQKIKRPLAVGLACVALATSTGCGKRGEYLMHETKVGETTIKLIREDYRNATDNYKLEVYDKDGMKRAYLSGNLDACLDGKITDEDGREYIVNLAKQGIPNK